MSALTVIQDAVELLPITDVPTTIEGTSGPDVKSLIAALNKTGRMLPSRHEWNALGREFSFTASGASPQSEALPSDWSKAFSRASVWRSGSNLVPMSGPVPPDEWHQLIAMPGLRYPGYWRLFGQNIEVIGAPADETVSVEYIRKGWVVPATGDNKERASKDADTFLYPEYLLTLGTVYSWRQTKGLTYAEEMADFEHQLEIAIAADRMARPIALSRRFRAGDVPYAWPGVIST